LGERDKQPSGQTLACVCRCPRGPGGLLSPHDHSKPTIQQHSRVYFLGASHFHEITCAFVCRGLGILHTTCCSCLIRRRKVGFLHEPCHVGSVCLNRHHRTSSTLVLLLCCCTRRPLDLHYGIAHVSVLARNNSYDARQHTPIRVSVWCVLAGVLSYGTRGKVPFGATFIYVRSSKPSAEFKIKHVVQEGTSSAEN